MCTYLNFVNSVKNNGRSVVRSEYTRVWGQLSVIALWFIGILFPQKGMGRRGMRCAQHVLSLNRTDSIQLTKREQMQQQSCTEHIFPNLLDIVNVDLSSPTMDKIFRIYSA